MTYDIHMAELVVRQSYYPALFVARVVNTIVGVIEVALAVRILLELFGASASSPFVAWVYGISAALMGPFAGAFPALSLGSTYVLDIVAILAMIGYAALGWLIVQLLTYMFVSTNAV